MNSGTAAKLDPNHICMCRQCYLDIADLEKHGWTSVRATPEVRRGRRRHWANCEGTKYYLLNESGKISLQWPASGSGIESKSGNNNGTTVRDRVRRDLDGPPSTSGIVKQ